MSKSWTHVTVDNKFTYDEASKTCTFVGIMEEPEKYAILDCCTTPEARATIERLYRKSYGIPLEQPKTAAERGIDFSVPLLSVQQGDLFEPFEESHFLEIPWRLSKYPPTFTESDYAAKQFDGKVIDIDVDDRGKVSKSFLKELRHQISFLEPDDDESVAALVHWIDKNIPNRADIFSSESCPWLIGVIHYLLNERTITLQELFHDKYTLRQRIVAKIDALRRTERQKAYQAFLLPECATPIVVTPALCFRFKPDEYPCNAKYLGSFKFKKHYYKEIASLNGEEEECAIYLDQLPEVEF